MKKILMRSDCVMRVPILISLLLASIFINSKNRFKPRTMLP